MWTEFVLTVVYLINRIPSVVLSRKSRYEVIYKIEPSLSYFKSFGCLCFATMLNNNDKFAARSDKCVFIVVIKSNEPYDDKRDSRLGDSDGINKSPDCADVSTDTSPNVTSHIEEVVTESPSRHSNSNPDGLGSSGASPKGDDATLYDDEYDYEGEDFVDFN
ncbi:hypothetical protein Tco_0742893 [Tanacetum coccineum]